MSDIFKDQHTQNPTQDIVVIKPTQLVSTSVSLILLLAEISESDPFKVANLEKGMQSTFRGNIERGFEINVS